MNQNLDFFTVPTRYFGTGHHWLVAACVPGKGWRPLGKKSHPRGMTAIQITDGKRLADFTVGELQRKTPVA